MQKYEVHLLTIVIRHNLNNISIILTISINMTYKRYKERIKLQQTADEKGKCIYKQCSYDDETYIELHGDASLLITRYQKDRTFGQMRIAVYEKMYEEYYERSERNEEYKRNRMTLKEKNYELHKLFYEKKIVSLKELIDKYVSITIHKFPDCLNINLTNARIVGSYDGNGQTMLLDDDNYFYVISYSTS